MSEQEEINLFEKINEGIKEAQRRLFEKKAKLGESVVIADDSGQPLVVPAQQLINSKEPFAK